MISILNDEYVIASCFPSQEHAPADLKNMFIISFF